MNNRRIVFQKVSHPKGLRKTIAAREHSLEISNHALTGPGPLQTSGAEAALASGTSIEARPAFFGESQRWESCFISLARRVMMWPTKQVLAPGWYIVMFGRNYSTYPVSTMAKVMNLVPFGSFWRLG